MKTIVWIQMIITFLIVCNLIRLTSLVDMLLKHP